MCHRPCFRSLWLAADVIKRCQFTTVLLEEGIRNQTADWIQDVSDSVCCTRMMSWKLHLVEHSRAYCFDQKGTRLKFPPHGETFSEPSGGSSCSCENASEDFKARVVARFQWDSVQDQLGRRPVGHRRRWRRTKQGFNLSKTSASQMSNVLEQKYCITTIWR